MSKAHRAKSVRSKCIKRCPLHIGLYCVEKNVKGTRGVKEKRCSINVPGILKKHDIPSHTAGKMIGSIIRQLKAKNCVAPTVHNRRGVSKTPAAIVAAAK